MILKHLCLSGILDIIQSKITWFWGYILLSLLCSMSLISSNFNPKSIIFFQFWPGAFSQNCSKKPCQLTTTIAWKTTQQNLADVKSVKYYPLRAFTENLKQLSLILTNTKCIWRLEATNVIRYPVWNVTFKKDINPNMTSDSWSPVACWLFLAQFKHLTNMMYSQALSML